MNLRLVPVRVGTGSPDEDGLLVFADGDRLMAVLTRLADQHGELAGQWFVEAGFGALDGPDHPTFAELDDAQAWIRQTIAGPH